MVAEGVVTIDGHDKSAEKRLDRYDAIPCALDIFQTCVGRGNAFCWYMCNVTLKCMYDTKTRLCSYGAIPTKIVIVVNFGCVIYMGEGNGIRLYVGSMCGGKGISGDGTCMGVVLLLIQVVPLNGDVVWSRGWLI